MTRVLEQQLKNSQTKNLYKVLAAIDDQEKVAKFLRDLLTIEEITEMGKRLEVAKLLSKKITFREITKKTGVSTTTTARINYWFNHGTGGYDFALEMLK